MLKNFLLSKVPFTQLSLGLDVSEKYDKTTCEGGTCPVVLQLLKEELQLDSAKSILDFDLCLYDHHKPSLGGAYDEFIFSARQDNLVSCYIAMEAIIG